MSSANRIVLTKMLALLYRENSIESQENTQLVRTLLNIVKMNETETQIYGDPPTKELYKLIEDVLEHREDLEKSTLIDRLKVSITNDEKFLNSIISAIEPDYDAGTTKRIITSLVKYLNNYYREVKINEIVNKASYDIKFNRGKIGDIFEYVRGLILELEPYTSSHSVKDPAVMSEIDFDSEDTLIDVINEVKKSIEGTVLLRTGWQALNRMAQGGFRRGEFVTIAALQHKYKTGFTLSLFMQLALFNTPVLHDKTKKPLLLRISFEDSLNNNIQFMYQYLRAREGNFDPRELTDIDSTEMSKYIINKLTANGYNIKLLRVDPTKWSYVDIHNKINELEAQGYEIHLLMLDYLGLVPTTGCQQGPTGFDRRDQFRRVRNFCSSKGITVITPHQLSTESKNIIKTGIVPEVNFVKEIAEKGYYDGSRTLDQEIDLELYIHLVHHKRKTYLTVQRGKHRLPTVVDPEDKYFILPFANKNVPILDDIEGMDISLKSLPKDETSSDKILSELF